VSDLFSRPSWTGAAPAAPVLSVLVLDAWRDGCAAEVVEDTSDARLADDLGRREQPT
jgi:hypothetical protein